MSERGGTPPPGWYDDAQSGGRRYWDGSAWHQNPVDPQPSISYTRLMLAVWAAIMLAWVTLWLGSKISDDIYLPTKTVVERPEARSVEEALELIQ